MSTKCVSSVGVVLDVLLYILVAFKSALVEFVQDTTMLNGLLVEAVRFVGAAGASVGADIVIFTALV